jgi:predicted metal-dependent RNase
MKIASFGTAGGEVTRSAYLLATKSVNVRVDCLCYDRDS